MRSAIGRLNYFFYSWDLAGQMCGVNTHEIWLAGPLGLPRLPDELRRLTAPLTGTMRPRIPPPAKCEAMSEN